MVSWIYALNRILNSDYFFYFDITFKGAKASGPYDTDKSSRTLDVLLDALHANSSRKTIKKKLYEASQSDTQPN